MVAMYVPAHFEASNEQLSALLAAPGLVDLVSIGPDSPIATPLPMLYVAAGTARGGSWATSLGTTRTGTRPAPDSLAIVRGPGMATSHRPGTRQGRARPGGPDLELPHRARDSRLVAHESAEWLLDLAAG
jgi:hypothetical protein